MDVQGYRALKLSASHGVRADRYLYLRRHADKKEQNVLFVANLPPLCTKGTPSTAAPPRRLVSLP